MNRKYWTELTAGKRLKARRFILLMHISLAACWVVWSVHSRLIAKSFLKFESKCNSSKDLSVIYDVENTLANSRPDKVILALLILFAQSLSIEKGVFYVPLST